MNDFLEGEDLLGISTALGLVGLPDGAMSGGRVFVGGREVGIIEEDGTWYNGLAIRFNGSATSQTIEALVRSITYTSLNPFSSVTYARGIAVSVTDEFGALSAINQVTVKVDNPDLNPTVSLGRTAHRISDTETVQAFAGAVLADPSPDGGYTLIVKLDAAHKGILTGYTAGTFEAGTYTVQGTRVEVQTQLRLLTFTPTDSDAPDSTETTTLTVTLRDLEQNEGHATVTVTSVDGVAHHDPENIALSQSLVFEHEEAGTVVGYLSGEDADGDQLTYRLVDNAGGRFIVEGNAIKVADGARIDFEQMRELQVTVRADDGWGRTTDRVFQIGVRNVLHERATGTSGDDRMEGGVGHDEFKGENGSDVLAGGGGNDTLWGGAGEDVFVFRHVGTSNRDVIEDFDPAGDKIHLTRAEAFAALDPGSLGPGAFQVGTQAREADDRIIYNPATGTLLYDSDGTGSRAALAFAVLDAGLNLLETHFLVI
jgi:Ca2+-binding RTX toxin-like protein